MPKLKINEKPAKEHVVAAQLHIKDPIGLGHEGRKQLAAWLRVHADSLTKWGDGYAKNFTGRYFLPGKK